MRAVVGVLRMVRQIRYRRSLMAPLLRRHVRPPCLRGLLLDRNSRGISVMHVRQQRLVGVREEREHEQDAEQVARSMAETQQSVHAGAQGHPSPMLHRWRLVVPHASLNA